MSDLNVATVGKVYEAFGRGDAAAVAAACADDTVWDFDVADSDVPWHLPVRSRGEVPRFLGAFVENVELKQFEPASFIHSGEDVIAHIRISYMVRRTGKVVTMDQLHWWTLRDGRIARLRHFEDTAQVLGAWRS